MSLSEAIRALVLRSEGLSSRKRCSISLLEPKSGQGFLFKCNAPAANSPEVLSHGFRMALAWFCHGFSMVLAWF